MNIKKIEKLHPNWYSKDSDLSYGDQLWIWENTPLPQEDIEKIMKSEMNEGDVSVNSKYGNWPRKQQVNQPQTLSKKEALNELKGCNYRSPPLTIAKHLNILLSNEKTKPSHWLFIARRYPPKTINSALTKTLKGIATGNVDYDRRAKYFTFIVKKRPIRRNLRKKEEKVTPPDF